MAAAAELISPTHLPDQPVYLIDASVFVYCAWHSVPNSLVDHDGNAVNALHGFARFLGDLIEEVRPTYLAVAFDDTTVVSFRNKLYPAYKANRDPAPVELKRQFLLCRELCAALGIAAYANGAYEADDIIGTLTTLMRAEGRCVTLVTRDKDLSQLVRPGDHFWDYIGARRYAYEQIASRFGVVPERMACYLALVGDAVDNIRGVPGIGPKTASMLMHHFESIHHLYDDIDRVLKLKVRNAGFVTGQLRDYRESALLARQLTGIACDMPLEVDCETVRRRSPDLAALNQFYDRVGFGRLLRNQAERIIEADRRRPR